MTKENRCIECNQLISLIKHKESISLCNQCNNKYIGDNNPYYKNGKKPVWVNFTEY